MLGLGTIDRVKNMGNDIRDWRERAKMSTTLEDTLMNQRFGAYVSGLGKDMLQMVSSIDEDENVIQARINAKKKAVEAKQRLKRRSVKVADMEEGDEASKMDEEWDTSAWSDEMVEDGVAVLFDVFYDPETRRDEVKKVRACLMLEKLINRHEAAELYVRKNIALLVGLSANRFIKDGQSCGMLDLLYILHAARTKYIPELSENNFAGRATDMLMLEARQSVLMLQHMVRAHTSRKKNRERIEEVDGLIGSFGTAAEVALLSDANILKRTESLKNRWIDMHVLQSPEERCTAMGYRSPVHIGPKYSSLVMEILLSLVSENATKMAQVNREELVRSGGCILLAQMLGIPQSPFVAIAAQILSHVSKIAESLSPIIHSGCIVAGVKGINYFRKTGKMSWAMSSRKIASRGESRSDGRKGSTPSSPSRSPMQQSIEDCRIIFLDIIAMFANASAHAAAIHRARSGFDFNTSQEGNVESNDYGSTLKLSASQLSEECMRLHLGNRSLLNTLMALMKELTSLHSIRTILRIFFNLACSDCYNTVLEEVLACGGKNLMRIVDFLEERDGTVSSLSLGILIQLCTRRLGREGLLATNLARILATRTKCCDVYSRRPYQRALLVAASVLRCDERRAYNPLNAPFLLVDPEAVRKLVYLDLLKSFKRPPLEIADALSIADLVLLPFSKSLPLKVSKGALALSVSSHDHGVMDLCDFLCHPSEQFFFESLPWDESAAGCIIMDGFSRHAETSRVCYSAGTIRYLAQCLYWGRHLIKDGPALLEKQLVIALLGVTSAANALASMCKSASDDPERKDAIIFGIHDVDVITATSYFINTLSQNHPMVREDLKKIQIRTGRSALLFFDSYCGMILSMEGLDPAREEFLLSELAEVGRTVAGLLQKLKGVHGGSAIFPKLFDGMCTFLARLLTSRIIVESALTQWKLLEALRAHLPHPLTALGEKGADDEAFRAGLGMLPSSFFDVCTAICVLDRGKGACLVDGFLRRSIEKVLLLLPKLESREEMLRWTSALNKYYATSKSREEYSLDILRKIDPDLKPSTARLEVAAALNLIAACSSFAHPAFGSSNDVIMMQEYQIVHICKVLISVEETPRCDPVVVAAMQVLGGLSKDVYRAAPIFESMDILGLIAKQMAQVPMLPQKAVESALDAVNNMAATGSEYVVDQLRNLREPLLKVNRVMPVLASKVADTNWNATTTFFRSERKAEEKSAVKTILAPLTHLTISTNSPQMDDTHSIFENDRILREQLQKLYSAAGLEEEAQALSPTKKQSLGSIIASSPVRSSLGLPSPSSTMSDSSYASPSPKSQGQLRLNPLDLSQSQSQSHDKSPLNSSSSFGSPCSNIFSPASSPSKHYFTPSPGGRIAPINSGSSRKSKGKSNSKSNNKSNSNSNSNSKGSPIMVYTTWDMPELIYTRPPKN